MLRAPSHGPFICNIDQPASLGGLRGKMLLMMSSVRILLLEDNPLNAELLRIKLERAGLHSDILQVETESGFRAALNSGHLDLIISDYSLPGFDGKKALAAAKERQPNIPFIFVSEAAADEIALESLLGGA